MDYKKRNDVPTLHARNDDYELRMKSKYIYYIFLNVITVILVIITVLLINNDSLLDIYAQIIKIPNIVKLMLLISIGLIIVQ